MLRSAPALGSHGPLPATDARNATIEKEDTYTSFSRPFVSPATADAIESARSFDGLPVPWKLAGSPALPLPTAVPLKTRENVSPFAAPMRKLPVCSLVLKLTIEGPRAVIRPMWLAFPVPLISKNRQGKEPSGHTATLRGWGAVAIVAENGTSVMAATGPVKAQKIPTTAKRCALKVMFRSVVVGVRSKPCSGLGRTVYM